MSNWCTAPTKVAPRVSGAVLKSIFLFLTSVAVLPHDLPRHYPQVEVPAGSLWNIANPLSAGPQRIAYLDSKKLDFSDSEFIPGHSLLTAGYRQGVELGKVWRPFFKKTKIAQKLKSDRVRFNSSDYDGAAQTALWFAHGAWPPGRDKKLYIASTGNASDQPLGCPFCRDTDFRANLTKALASGEGARRANGTRKLLKGYFKPRVVDGLSDWELLNLGSAYLPYYCNGGALPKKLTKDVFRLLLSNRAFVERTSALLAPNKTIQPINNFVLAEIDAHLKSQQGPHFTIASAAGPAVVAFLVGLNATELEAPLPAASHLAVEVWDNGSNYVRVVLNGEVIPIAGEELVALDEFRVIIDRSGSNASALAKLTYEVRRLKEELEKLKQETIEALKKAKEEKRQK